MSSVQAKAACTSGSRYQSTKPPRLSCMGEAAI